MKTIDVVCNTVQQHCKELATQNRVMLLQMNYNILEITEISKTKFSGDGVNIIT